MKYDVQLALFDIYTTDVTLFDHILLTNYKYYILYDIMFDPS